jgi:hypothetical protein
VSATSQVSLCAIAARWSRPLIVTWVRAEWPSTSTSIVATPGPVMLISPEPSTVALAESRERQVVRVRR